MVIRPALAGSLLVSSNMTEIYFARAIIATQMLQNSEHVTVRSTLAKKSMKAKSN